MFTHSLLVYMDKCITQTSCHSWHLSTKDCWKNAVARELPGNHMGWKYVVLKFPTQSSQILLYLKPKSFSFGCAFQSFTSVILNPDCLQLFSLSWDSWDLSHYLRNGKHVPCFFLVIETWVKVWENEKCCGNTSLQLFEFFHVFFLLENIVMKKGNIFSTLVIKM